MMAYGVVGRGMLSSAVPRLADMTADDIRKRLPRFQDENVAANMQLRAALEALARKKSATLAQLAIAWTMAQGERPARSSCRYPARNRASTLRRMWVPPTSCSRPRISRKSIASHRARCRGRHALSRRTNAPIEPVRREFLTLRATSGSGQNLQSLPREHIHSITLSASDRNDFGDREPERLGSLEINNEIEFGRLLDQDIAGLRPAQNLINKIGGAPDRSAKFGPQDMRSPAWTELRFSLVVYRRSYANAPHWSWTACIPTVDSSSYVAISRTGRPASAASFIP